MITIPEYIRRTLARHPGAVLPTARVLTEMCRNGAPWGRQNHGRRWHIIDEVAADRALGLTAEPAKAAA